jgi:hypothetical protein
MQKIYVICFAKRSENHAKPFAFRFHFAWSEKKYLSEKGTPQSDIHKVRVFCSDIGSLNAALLDVLVKNKVIGSLV